MQPQTATDLLVHQFSFGAAWLISGAQLHLSVVGRGTVGLAGTWGWGERTALSPAQPWPSHVWGISDLLRNPTAPSHPGLPHMGQPGKGPKANSVVLEKGRTQEGCNSHNSMQIHFSFFPPH